MDQLPEAFKSHVNQWELAPALTEIKNKINELVIEFNKIREELDANK